MEEKYNQVVSTQSGRKKGKLKFITSTLIIAIAISCFIYKITQDSYINAMADYDFAINVISGRGLDVKHSAAVGSSVGFAMLAYGFSTGPLVITPYPWLSYIFACVASAAAAGLGAYGGIDTWEWFK